MKNGWRMKEIDEMDMLGFLRLRAWDATREQEKKKPRQRFIDVGTYQSVVVEVIFIDSTPYPFAERSGTRRSAAPIFVLTSLCTVNPMG